MGFKKFRDVIEKQFNRMAKTKLYISNANKNDVWEKYLEAFPKEENEIFRTNRAYDCSACRDFIKHIGNVVALDKNNQLITIWDVEVQGYYQEVANRLSAYIKNFDIQDIFLHKEKHISIASNNELLEDNSVTRWHHFSCVLPQKYISNNVTSDKAYYRKNKDVFQRGIQTLTIEALEIVRDLIYQKSIYRGEEFKKVVNDFLTFKVQYNALNSAHKKNNFLWDNVHHKASTFKNSVIGSFVEDLSKGKSIDDAVREFENKVAPINYKRSSAPVSKGMVKEAIKKINTLGVEGSLERRFAIASDVSINNVLFADRSVSPFMQNSLESILMKEVTPSSKSYNSIKTIGIDDFILSVLPKIDTIEMLFDNRHISNLVSLISARDNEAKHIFQWDNPFSWSYHGDITDANIKEKVKSAGGDVSGDLRISLSWYNTDDLDIHLIEPDNYKVWFSNKKSALSGATLDVDMNANTLVRDAVENITWAKKEKIKKGIHTIAINNYTSREAIDVGFVVEVEYLGEIKQFSYAKKVKQKESVNLFEFQIKGNHIDFLNIHPQAQEGIRSKEVWNIKTEAFHKVSMMMLSPNYWDNQTIGNRHHFFLLEGCHNPKEARGFYNEFLRSDFIPHRKVFELLADKMKCAKTSEQLSGLGFSSTKKDEVICKVSGNFTRTLKIKF